MRATDDLYAPVVALDVDGVMRIPEPLPGEKAEVIEIEVTMSREEYPSWYHRPPRWNDDGTHTGRYFFSAVGLAWVRSLLERGVDVRWCTTWEDWANLYFAGPIGLPELPVITGQHRRGEGPERWKARTIAAATRGRPVLWVDDNAWEEELRRLHTPRALTGNRMTNPELGIVPPDVKAMNAWLSLASTPDGHDELRRQWRRERDQLRRAYLHDYPPDPSTH